ncbi:NAD(P)-dependent oxidoreductase [Frankia sp. AgKG'84/4]|uniref:NAD(P)-dependent oxidoreductase n=1 Tax=Frankia sp. AgKG'84/4 TaxID=573490 RepID=UPI00200D3A01|nr:NAD(P)H-binding protein [Frankia sp. AgKG'84/4]MCL9798041.1 NAD(P)H-binding protein [Frankia sp. AgKG'84/4]
MKLTIFAATGGIGRLLLTQALAAGHDVSVVVRRPEAVTPSPGRVIAADLASVGPDELVPALAGADAVLSGLGGPSRADTDIATRGTQTIIAAMRAAGVARIIVVSAAPIATVPSPARPNPLRHDPGDGPLTRRVLAPAIKAALRGHYADLARMEDALRASGLDWTIVRPPRLTNGKLTASYRTAHGRNLRGGTSVSRADVAHYMLRAAENGTGVGETVGIAG